MKVCMHDRLLKGTKLFDLSIYPQQTANEDNLSQGFPEADGLWQFLFESPQQTVIWASIKDWGSNLKPGDFQAKIPVVF